MSKKARKAEQQDLLAEIAPLPVRRGRPRIHKDKAAAQAAASQAYRDRRKARRQAPTIEDRGIIDLSAIPAYRVRKK